MNVTTKSMRGFAADCLAWAAQMRDTSHRQSIITAARQWAVTARAIDRQVRDEHRVALPDLRTKLD